MGCGAKTKDLILEDQKSCIRGCLEFKRLGVIDKEDRQEIVIKNMIIKGRAITAMLKIYCGRTDNQKQYKLQIYNSIEYGAETSEFNKNLGSELISIEMDFFQEIGEMLKILKNQK